MPQGPGFFYPPTLLTHVGQKSEIVQEEVFGPVLVIQIAEDFDHATDLANGTDYGLVAGIYTRDIAKAFRFAKVVDDFQVDSIRAAILEVLQDPKLRRQLVAQAWKTARENHDARLAADTFRQIMSGAAPQNVGEVSA